MIEQYLPVLAMIATGIGFGLISAKAHEWLGPHRPNRQKSSTYESGMPPVSTAHERFSIKFYLVAMLFILFDIEVVFMYPWAVSFRSLGSFALWAMLLFIVTLFVGYVYIVKKGALKWD
jgi:NADH-quinone oxidoreductase subunit A